MVDAEEGLHALGWCVADPDESRTGNNNGTLRFNVQGPYEPGPPDDGGEALLGGLTPMQFIGIMVIAIVAAVVAVALLRYY